MTTETAPQQTQTINYKHGDWCHFELPVNDLARAKKFYGEAFGWTFNDMPEMEYTLYQTPGGFGGGFFKPSERMPEKVINYVNVEDLNASAKKCESLGGKLLGPVIDVPGHGKMQHLLDTEGTLFSLWQGQGNQGAN